SSEGEAKGRPAALGSDAGFSGGVGAIAVPGSLALLAIWPARRRWLAIVLALGAIVAVAMGQGRLQLIEGVLAAIAFVALASLAGRARKPLMALVTVVAIAIPFAAASIGLVRSGTFSRYASLESESAGEIATHKADAYTEIPHQLSL